MDPISLALTRWVTLVSRLAALSLSLHRGYRSARNGVVGFASLCGTISRALANLSSRFARFGSLELQDILLLWAVLRTLRGFVHRLFGRLGLGFFALPALPAWLRQLGAALAAPPALPSAAPSFGLPSAPGARSALLSASSWSGYPSALPAWSSSALAPAPPAYQPWPLAGGQRLALPPHFQRHGLPAGHRRPAPGSAQAEFLSGLSLASAAASSAPLPALPSVWSSASAPGLPAPPAHLPWPGYPVFGPPAPCLLRRLLLRVPVACLVACRAGYSVVCPAIWAPLWPGPASSICSDGRSSRPCSSLCRLLFGSALWRAFFVCPVVYFGFWRLLFGSSPRRPLCRSSSSLRCSRSCAAVCCVLGRFHFRSAG
ncbi:unnamed protein product [Sordaria macrospora k-hell]|uniref:WGS project CABT00000000 data, contig 2.43 n=1 Tax=Sordaria macrospora (strain ATCC MYA-333 / DSM 997 / K(L3346) / K-hell) TaxID=771870 RepID=F7W854_SORMK|nr:uncharacterized protein SMAC_08202 [Sordaria macrospora k-hell]CCC13699.1 unnamed protein product [Sordaria macrospora k-hell]